MSTVFSYFTAPLRFRSVFRQFLRREILGRYRGSMLGITWAFINPLLMLGVYTFVFVEVFKARWPGAEDSGGLAFAQRIFAGLMVFNMFSEVVARAPVLIVEQANLVKKVAFPLELLPFIVVGSALFHFAISAAILIFSTLAFDHRLPASILLLPVVILPLLPLLLGLGWLLSALGVFVRDIGSVVVLFVSLLMFMSPVFYSASSLSPVWQFWMNLNPLTAIIENLRLVVFSGAVPDWAGWSLSLGIASALALVGAWFLVLRAMGLLMSFDRPAIRASSLTKTFAVYEQPLDQLKQLLAGRKRQYGKRYSALSDVSFELPRGQVLGLVGDNGAGKSTLLQLVCKTLMPSSGSVEVNGRVAALLELGAGFNPEFSGRENIYLNAAVLGLTQAEIESRYTSIVEFSGVGDFIEQPVKTYSSGMYMRLAFSIATCVDPDILVIDEALSVGDGAFARKSFDRIMALRSRGATILFCSHSMYHIEAICDQAIWLERGRVKMHGPSDEVARSYIASLTGTITRQDKHYTETMRTPTGSGSILKVSASAAGVAGKKLRLQSKISSLEISVKFSIDPLLPVPTVGIAISNESKTIVASVISVNDGIVMATDKGGMGQAKVTFPQIPLLKGVYFVSVYLACEQAIHVYDTAESCVELAVEQNGIERGFVSLDHSWEVGA